MPAQSSVWICVSTQDMSRDEHFKEQGRFLCNFPGGPRDGENSVVPSARPGNCRGKTGWFALDAQETWWHGGCVRRIFVHTVAAQRCVETWPGCPQRRWRLEISRKAASHFRSPCCSNVNWWHKRKMLFRVLFKDSSSHVVCGQGFPWRAILSFRCNIR